jgi:hypothetical protein
LVCPTGQTACGNACVNLLTDPSNCGACGNSCGAGACSNGTCTCSGGYLAMCNGTCVNTSTDSNNCNGCGNVCSPGYICKPDIAGYPFPASCTTYPAPSTQMLTCNCCNGRRVITCGTGCSVDTVAVCQSVCNGCASSVEWCGDDSGHAYC